MRVVIVNNLYAPNRRGGAERSVQLLAEALVAAGARVTVVCAERREQPAAELNGVKVVTVAAANLYWPFGEDSPPLLQRRLWHLLDVYSPIMRRRLEGVLDGERPDLLHTNNLQGITVSAWSAARRRRLPILHTLRDYYLVCARASRFRDGRNCVHTCAGCLAFCAARRSASRHVDGVAGVSRFILDRHASLDLFPRAAVREVIANPASPVADTPRRAGEKLVFGFLGRLEPAKGLERLLQTFAARDDTGWELVIAGRGPSQYVAQLQGMASRALRPSQIQFVGWADSDGILPRLDVVVVPSLWHEPLSRAAIEAQASGLPVIAARRGGLPEIVEHGATGWLFEPDEPRGLDAVVEQLIDQPQLVRRCGAQAAAAAARFAPAAIAAQYLETYEALLRARGAGSG